MWVQHSSVCSQILATKPFVDFIKFRIRDLYRKSSGEIEFGKNRPSGRHALRQGADEVLSVFPILF